VQAVADTLARRLAAAAAPGSFDATTDAASPLAVDVDGAIYLVRELAAIAPPAAAALLPALGDATAALHCPAAVRQSLARQLPAIAAGVGKPAFKRALDAFLPTLADLAAQPEATAGQRAASFAALDAAAQLRRFVGPTIFDGRLTREQAAALQVGGAREGHF
jgi:hypothetical protein